MLLEFGDELIVFIERDEFLNARVHFVNFGDRSNDLSKMRQAYEFCLKGLDGTFHGLCIDFNFVHIINLYP